MSLSTEQETVAQNFVSFIADPDQKEFVICGAAGTGKTYLLANLLNCIDTHNKLNKTLGGNFVRIHPVLTATTNKAVSVLTKLLKNSTFDGFIAPTTIHSFMNLSVKNDMDSAATKLIVKGNFSNFEGQLIFIDEASMINNELFALIRKYLDKSKIVYLGDSYQLPPVKEDNSLVFKIKPLHELKQIQRQAAGSPIIKLSQKFRAMIDEDKFSSWPEIIADNNAIFRLTGPQFKELVVEKFSNQTFLGEVPKVVTYTNERAIAYNNFIRGLYTQDPEFVPNELVITNKPIVNPLHKGVRELLTSGDSELVIHSMIEGKLFDIDGYFVMFHWITGAHFMPKDRQAMKARMKQCANAKDWENYHAIKDLFIDIRSGYAITSHKSQGSTYKEVFIDLEDIRKNRKWKETCKLLYVAITRASERVYFYGDLG